jgi:hypothetical protein
MNRWRETGGSREGANGRYGEGATGRGLWWGEAPERPDGLTEANRKSLQFVREDQDRAEPWPTIDHGSARFMA